MFVMLVQTKPILNSIFLDLEEIITLIKNHKMFFYNMVSVNPD